MQRETEKLRLVDLSSYDFNTLCIILMFLKLLEFVTDAGFVVGIFKTAFRLEFSAKKQQQTNKQTKNEKIPTEKIDHTSLVDLITGF